MVKVAIIIYSLYNHVATMAAEVKKGIESVEGATADIFQVPETLSEEILNILGSSPSSRPKLPIATPETLTEYDAIVFGMPTRFGAMPTQIKTFLDGTGGLWASGALYQKPVGVFVSTGSGSGKEFTVFNCLSTFAHHGMIYIPLGYSKVFAELTNISEPHGGSPWGAGCLAGPDGSRQPSELELKLARVQGEEFAHVVVPYFKKGKEVTKEANGKEANGKEANGKEANGKVAATKEVAAKEAAPPKEAKTAAKQVVKPVTKAPAKEPIKSKKGFFSKLLKKLT
ncbi:DEKNAAC100846 [Brettanomyces naardenensis]|uniref:DEKNAAC100846 n=1 Tax=Brettanomyces naardenensis TaxID=13370 RepID=A0A448YEL2_BRENA|nr:DEKNAAC100846 [Brettanomyces naardenensis]